MKIGPGLAFSMPITGGYMMGIFTHDRPRVGSVIWVADPIFTAPPSLEDAARVTSWRWPLLIPLPAAIRRHTIEPIGVIPLPDDLREFPTFRGGGGKLGWMAFREVGGTDRMLGPTQDASLPIYKLVGVETLREMVETNWRPEDDF